MRCAINTFIRVPPLCRWSLQITFEPDWECLVDFFLQSEVENLLVLATPLHPQYKILVLSQVPVASRSHGLIPIIHSHKWWVPVKNFWPGLVRVNFFATLVGSGQPSWVWMWKTFNFFPFGSKKISSDRVKKYLGQRQVSLYYYGSKLCSSWVRAHL